MRFGQAWSTYDPAMQRFAAALGPLYDIGRWRFMTVCHNVTIKKRRKFVA